MKIKWTLTLLLVFLVSSVSAQSVDEILAKHVEALGGAEKISAITSLKILGTVSRGGGRFEMPFTRYWKAPNKYRNESEMRGNKMIQATDGETAWAVMPFGRGGRRRGNAGGNTGPQVLEGPRAQSFLGESKIFGLLYGAVENGYEIEYVGTEEFEGTEVIKLELLHENGRKIHSYLDAEYFLEIKRETHRSGPDGQSFTATTLFSDFKEVNGVMIAHSITNQAGGGGARRGGGRGFGGGSTQISKIEVNVEINDALFSMPKK